MYRYSKKIEAHLLVAEIKNSTISKELENISIIGSNTVEITFDQSLDAGEKTTLDDIVSNHDSEKIVFHDGGTVQVDEQGFLISFSSIPFGKCSEFFIINKGNKEVFYHLDKSSGLAKGFSLEKKEYKEYKLKQPIQNVFLVAKTNETTEIKWEAIYYKGDE